jgi:hypothetical protein
MDVRSIPVKEEPMADTNNWDIKQLVQKMLSLKDLTELDVYKVLIDAYTSGFEAGKKQKKSR